MEEFEGYWWLPNNEEHKLSGKLKVYSDKHSELVIIAGHNDIEHAFPPLKGFGDISEIQPYDIILGYAKSGSKTDISITLNKCNIIRTNTSGLMEVTFQVENVIQTLHFLTIEELKFSSLFLKLDFLEEWVMKTGFKIINDLDSKKFKAKIEYTHPEEIILLDNGKYYVYLWFRPNIPMSHSFGNLKLKEEAFINFEFKETLPIEDVKRLIQVVQDLFSFMIATPVSRKSVEFRRYTDEESKTNGLANHTCELIYPELIDKNVEKMTQDRMMITLKSFLSKNESILENWLNSYDKISQVKRLYFDTFYNNYMSSETRFLNLTMALEIYHYRTLNQNKIRLKKRINELLNNHLYLTMYFDSDLAKFTKRIVHTRNYYNHGGGEDDSLLIPTKYLLDYNIKMRILLEAIILRELGFSNDEIYFKITNVYKFSLIVEFP